MGQLMRNFVSHPPWKSENTSIIKSFSYFYFLEHLVICSWPFIIDTFDAIFACGTPDPEFRVRFLESF